MFLRVSLLLLGICCCSAAGQKKWAVIVSGAKDYNNYFSQADSCHAYHTLRNKGIPAENIIHLSYNDVAYSPENPFPGNLINKLNGTNVYKGCKMDYTQEEVTHQVFVAVLLGDKDKVKQLIGRDGRVVESGPDDHVFVTMVDHGGPNVFYFPNFVPMHNTDLINAIKEMHSNRRYKEMVLYVESCYSGSMFDDLLPKDINVYATTCSNPNESGYMCTWDETRQVYLGTQYGCAWMYDTDKSDPNKKTLYQQFEVCVAACKVSPSSTSHPQQYGDLTMNKEVLGTYQGGKSDTNTNRFGHLDKDYLMSDEFLARPPIDMVLIATLRRRLMSPRLALSKRLATEHQLEKAVEQYNKAKEFSNDVSQIVANVEGAVSGSHSSSDCYKGAIKQLDISCPGFQHYTYPFVRRNFRTLIGLCHQKDPEVVFEAIKQVSEGHPICNMLE